MNTNNTLQSDTLLQGKSYTYTIQQVLGQGSFGITYLATTKVKIAGALGALETTMQVAIKEFFMRDINGRNENTVTTGSQGGLYANYKKKFAREAENLSKLDHPNIVKVLEYFEANNTIYYAMEYVEGGSLDAYITQKDGLPEAECVKYAKQIGTALSYMHAHKMLHLDLKPGNVMLRKNGDAVLIDFGLSKQYDESGNPETSTTVGGGTPGYAPIEQANYHEGKGFPVTMDVYALGATMFKMLTGVRPPEAVEILNEGFPAYELQKHQVSDALIACVAKAMSALRKDRPQNIDAFLELLGGKDSSGKKRIRLHNSIDDILVSFTDSPFPGYRSFIAKFTRASITVQTFIGNELITKKAIPYSPAQFEALISAINALKLYKVSADPRKQSEGGETIRLEVENKLEVYHYGSRGSQEGTLTGDVYPLLELIQKEIPDFSDLWIKRQEPPHVSDFKPTGNFWQKYQKVIIGGLVGGLVAAGFVMISNTIQSGSPTPAESSAMDAFTVDSVYVSEDESDNETAVQLQAQPISKDFVLMEKGELLNYEVQLDKYINISVDSFYISKYELTQGEYERVMQHIEPENYTYNIGGSGKKNYIFIRNDSLPVIGTITNIAEYCNRRSEIEGYDGFYTITDTHVIVNPNGNGYRLPTEVEWLYAAHAGNLHETYKYAGSNKVAEVAWYGGNSKNKPHKVGLKKPNGKGLYDMTGNITEYIWGKCDFADPNTLRLQTYMDYENWVGTIDEIVGGFSPYLGARIILIPKKMNNRNLLIDIPTSTDRLIKDLKQ